MVSEETGIIAKSHFLKGTSVLLLCAQEQFLMHFLMLSRVSMCCHKQCHVAKDSIYPNFPKFFTIQVEGDIYGTLRTCGLVDRFNSVVCRGSTSLFTVPCDLD